MTNIFKYLGWDPRSKISEGRGKVSGVRWAWERYGTDIHQTLQPTLGLETYARLDYRTVSGVNGPLVILDGVKVSGALTLVCQVCRDCRVDAS